MAKTTNSPPPQSLPSDAEPSPFLGGEDPWRTLQPEHEEDLKAELDKWENERLEVAVLCVQVHATGQGPELLSIMRKMVKAMPRATRDQIVRRDAKADLLDWIEEQIEYAANYEG